MHKAFGQTNVYKTVASGIGPTSLTEDIAFLYHAESAEPTYGRTVSVVKKREGFGGVFARAG
jgi:hypothetical protein